MATIHKNHIKEAQRYLNNAREILSTKAEKEGSYYSDPKYVKMAGNTAWNGVLVALDGCLGIKEKLKKGQRPDFKHYLAAISKKDKKMSRPLLTAHDTLHKSLGYDGVLGYKSVQAAMAEGENVISWAAKHYKEA